MHGAASVDLTWAVVVPVKDLAVAKSRLVVEPAERRADLALAMAADVVAAALACDQVAGVVVVTNDTRAARVSAELGAIVVADVADSGLNDALTAGARYATAWHPRSGVAAMSSDLPALQTVELDAALQAAAAHPRAMVTDATGLGTTLLTARPGVALAPRFGGLSRSAHLRDGVVDLEVDAPGLRRDVDTADDLAVALELGVGTHTRAALG